MYTLDRFARNRYDSAIYKARLKRNGVKIYYAKQSMPDTPEEIILESVLEGYAKYYSENLARNIRRGLKENSMHGLVVGGMSLGYRVNEQKRYEIDPTGAKFSMLSVYHITCPKFGTQSALLFSPYPNKAKSLSVTSAQSKHGVTGAPHVKTPKNSAYTWFYALRVTVCNHHTSRDISYYIHALRGTVQNLCLAIRGMIMLYGRYKYV